MRSWSRLLLLLLFLIPVISIWWYSPTDLPFEVLPSPSVKESDPVFNEGLQPVTPESTQIERLSNPEPEVPQGEKEPDQPVEPKEDFEIWMRALDDQGTPLEGDISLPLLLDGNPVTISAGGGQRISGRELRTLYPGTESVLIPLGGGKWTLDATQQVKTFGGLIESPWAILGRPEPSDQRPTLIVFGHTPLPPGSRLRAQLIGEDRVLDGGILKTQAESNIWVLSLNPRQWFAGRLSLQMAWSWEASSQFDQDRVLEIRGGQSELRESDWEWSGSVMVDTAKVLAQQTREIKEWYRGALEEVEASRDLLLVAGAKARGKRAKLVKDDERMGKMLLHPLAPELENLGRKNSFDFKKWRRLMDEEFPAHWRVWLEKGAIPYPDRYPGPARNVQLMFHMLNKYSRLESTLIYSSLGRDRHINDFVADFDWDPVTERTQTLGKLRNFIDSIDEKIQPWNP